MIQRMLMALHRAAAARRGVTSLEYALVCSAVAGAVAFSFRNLGTSTVLFMMNRVLAIFD